MAVILKVCPLVMAAVHVMVFQTPYANGASVNDGSDLLPYVGNPKFLRM